MEKNDNTTVDTIESLVKDRDSLWHIIVAQSRDGIVLLDQTGKVFEVNKRYALMLGYTHEEMYNLHIWDWDTQFTKEELEEKIKMIDYDGHHFETTQKRKDGSIIDIECSNSATIFKGQKLIFCICRDITQRKHLENEIKYLASTDILTELPNRNEFQKKIKLEIYNTNRYNNSFSVIMYDIDYFKHINDSFGHPEGDIVLKSMSKLVKSFLRQTDLVARWGGEEFMIIMPQTNATSAKLAAEKLRFAIEEHNFNDNYKITASFGVTEYKIDDTLSTLLKRVDDALYVSKSEGRNRVTVIL